jgi:predicted ATPase
MSDGTLKALWLALLLFSPVQQSLLAIDEPELNLHPAWLKVIGGWLQRFCSAEQLFVSTHSPDLLDTFTEGFRTGQVALFVFGAGEQEIRRVETPELDEFFREGWELGDLYRIGEPKLGGWPW